MPACRTVVRGGGLTLGLLVVAMRSRQERLQHAHGVVCVQWHNAHGVVCVQWHNVRTVHRAAGVYSSRKRLSGADALGAAFKSLAGAQCAPAAKV